jgi:hypothetical protein
MERQPTKLMPVALGFSDAKSAQSPLLEFVVVVSARWRLTVRDSELPFACCTKLSTVSIFAFVSE